MGKQAQQDEPSLEELQKRAKAKIFQLVKCYLQHCEHINPIFIYLLVLLESLQVLWFSIHPQLRFLGDPFGLAYFRQALTYVNLENFLHQDSTLLFPFVVLCSTLILLHIATIALSAQLTRSNKKSELSTLVNKVVSLQIVLLHTVLFIPICNVSMITLYCDPEGYYFKGSGLTCYGSLHIVLCVLAGLCLLVLLLGGLAYWFLFYTRDPFSRSYYALSNNLFRLGKLAIKIVLPLYFVVDQKQSLQNIYIIVELVLLAAYILFFRINGPYNFHPPYFYFELFCESVLLWFCVNTAISYQVPCTGMNFVQACIGALGFAWALTAVEGVLTRKFFWAGVGGGVKKGERERFVYLLIGVLFKDYNESQISPLVYIKLLNSNLNLCSIKIGKFMQKGDLKTEEITEISRELLLNLIQKFLEETPSTNLKLIQSLILFASSQKILSLHEISEVRSEKLSLYEQFMIYYFKATHYLYEDTEMKNNDDNINEINTYLEFVELMNLFEAELENSARNNEGFWEELCEDMPSINKVYSLAEGSIKFSTRVSEVYRKIEAIFPENLAALNLYYQFLNHVCAKYKEHNKIREKWMLERERELKKENIEIEGKVGRIKFRANERMCVLHVSTNTSTIGIITNCNSEIKPYLGYEKSQLLNQKVTKIMPKSFSEIHDKFIRDYLAKADSMKLPTEKTVFAFRKDIKMVETCLAVKIFPNILSGFQLVGFFKENSLRETRMNIMVNLRTLEIEGMTDSFLKLAGNRIKLHQTQKQPLKLSHLFPQIEPSHVFKAGQSLPTLFRFSDCTDKLLDIDEGSQEARKKDDKNIILKLESTSYYPEVEIGNFLVTEPENIISMHETIMEANLQLLDPSPARPKSQKRSPTFISPSVTPKKSTAKLGEESDREQVSTQRKIQDFINTNSHLFEITMIKVMFFLCFGVLGLASIFYWVYEDRNFVGHAEILGELGLAEKIGILEGKIVLQNRLIFQASGDYQKWQAIRQEYLGYLKELQETATTLFQKANEQSRRSQSLVINEYNSYQFSTLPSPVSTQSSTQSIHYNDGLLKTIFIGLELLSNNISQFQPPVASTLLQSSYFISQNLKQILPGLAGRTCQAYSSLFSSYLESELANAIYFVLGKTTTFILFYCVMCFLINKFSRFNYVLVEIYNSILKWDVYELYLKCHRFRMRIFEPDSRDHGGSAGNNRSVVSIGRDDRMASDIWKMFPKGLILKLSEGLINQQGNENRERKMRTSITSKDSKLQQPVQASRPPSSQLLNPLQSKVDHINIKIEISLKKRVLYLFLLLLLLTFINYSFLFFKAGANQELIQEQIDNVNLGRFCKTFLFTLFYGVEALEDPGADGQLDRSRFFVEVEEFYGVSKNVSAIIGDPETYLRDVYKQVGLINSMVKNELLLNQTAQQALFSQSKVRLFRLSSDIFSLSQAHIRQTLSRISSTQGQIKVVKLLVDTALTLLFCYLSQQYLVKSAQRQLRHSSNMIKMIPVWIVHKNWRVKRVVFMRDKDKPKPKGEHDDETAVNLMDSKCNQGM